MSTREGMLNKYIIAMFEDSLSLRPYYTLFCDDESLNKGQYAFIEDAYLDILYSKFPVLYDVVAEEELWGMTDIPLSELRELLDILNIEVLEFTGEVQDND